MGPALVWSVQENSTAAGVATVAGVLAGPGLGHFYADAHGHAWTGILVRAGGAGAIAFGAPGVVNAALGGESNAGAEALFVGGVLAILGSATYDIFTAPGAAKDHNATHGLSAQVSSTVGPRGEQVGLSVRVQW